MAEQESLQKMTSTPITDTQNSSASLQTRPFAPVKKLHTSSSVQTKSDTKGRQGHRASGFGHSFGNLMVSPPTSLAIQPKLTIGQPGDKYEQEADNVAADVVQRINAPKAVSPKQQETLQREGMPEEEELQMKSLANSIQREEMPEDEELQMKPLANSIQREEMPEDEELQMKPLANSIQREEMQEDEELQMKSLANSIQREEMPEEEELQMKPLLQHREAIGGGQASTDLESSINSARGGGQPLDTGLQRSMGQAMGADFSSVKVHTDSQSDQLNRSIQAKAFTTGQDVFFRQGAYEPSSRGGQELIAHELTHVVQQNGGAVQRSPQVEEMEQATARIELPIQAATANTLQRVFNPTDVVSNAHLRKDGVWGTRIGPKIPSGAKILVDHDANNKTHQHWTGTETTWKPAVNILPTSEEKAIPDDQKGYIRSVRVGASNGSLEEILKSRIQTILQDAESKYASLNTHLNKQENIDFLLQKAIRHNVWNGGASVDNFVSGFSTKEDKITRIREGSEYVAESLEHWRKWLYDDPKQVNIEEVKFLQSDLHEQGLGVMKVKFKKPKGPEGHKFADQTEVEVIIKPEDKSLEENLLGDSPNSAANKINEIVGLTDPKEALATIKMSSDKEYGSLVEKVKGLSAEDLTKNGGPKEMIPAFHETLVFAFLAGIDDLHKENVFWHEGKPYLIDADNVLSYNQMINKDNGKYTQSGFGGYYNKEEAVKNKDAIKNKDNTTVNSKILQAMIEDKGKALKIIDAIKDAVTGKEGRVVPIPTQSWSMALKSFTTSQNKDEFLTKLSSENYIVRENREFSTEGGAGLIGTSYKNIDAIFYNSGAEKAELKKDFEAGVIPFYIYKFDTGHVTHNGTKIYHGQTLEQAMKVILNKFGWDK